MMVNRIGRLHHDIVIKNEGIVLIQKRKIFYLTWITHLLLTAAVGIAVIWVNAEVIKLDVQVSKLLQDVLQFSLNIILFPVKLILGNWIAGGENKWIFIPAVVINSFIWAVVVSLIVKRRLGSE